jgi:hypothetical protein
MKWILGGVGATVLIAILLVATVLRKGEAHVGSSDHLTNKAVRDDWDEHHVQPPILNSVVERFIPGDLFDTLWLSHEKDQDSGLIVGIHNGEPDLHIYLKKHKDEAQIKAVSDAMNKAGFAGSSQNESFDGRMSEADRFTTFTYHVPKDPSVIIKAVNTALNTMQPGAPPGYYMSGHNFAKEFPSKGHGVFIRGKTDPLRDFLNQVSPTADDCGCGPQ